MPCTQSAIGEYRWIIQPYLYDLVIRFDKVDKVFQVAIEPHEEA